MLTLTPSLWPESWNAPVTSPSSRPSVTSPWDASEPQIIMWNVRVDTEDIASYRMNLRNRRGP